MVVLPKPTFTAFKRYQKIVESCRTTIQTMNNNAPRCVDYNSYKEHEEALAEHSLIMNYLKELNESYSQTMQHCLDNDPHNQQ